MAPQEYHRDVLEFERQKEIIQDVDAVLGGNVDGVELGWRRMPLFYLNDMGKRARPGKDVHPVMPYGPHFEGKAHAHLYICENPSRVEILVDDQREAIEEALTAKLGERIAIHKRSAATIL